jgi:hypothetical protein
MGLLVGVRRDISEGGRTMMEVSNVCRIRHIERLENLDSLGRAQIMAPVQRDASFRPTVYCTVQSGYFGEQGY